MSSSGPISHAVAMHALCELCSEMVHSVLLSSLSHGYARSHPIIKKQLYHYCTLTHTHTHTQIIYLHIPFVQTVLIPLL